MKDLSPNTVGALSALIAVIFFSINDAAIKFLSDDYPLHQVVLIRSAIGMCVIVFVVAPLTVGSALGRTKKLHLHLLRGLCIVFANITFFLGLAAIPLADAIAIFFISPLVITLFSVLFLKETVGPRRWTAIAVGFLGVLVIVRPGTEAFQVASILPLVAAVSYAAVHMFTRRLGPGESAATMAFYIQSMFIVVSVLTGLAIGDGRFGDQADASLAFLFRAWIWPDPADLPIFALIGVSIAGAGYLISQAYRVAEASFVAPFEYIAVPMSVVLGMIIFDEFPSLVDYVGMALILGSGLFALWRDAKADEVPLQRSARR